MARFLVTNLFSVGRISDDAEYEFLEAKLGRDFPWLVSEHHEVVLSGLGKAWTGRINRQQVTSHAGFRSFSFFPLNAVLAWLVHLWDVLRLSHKTRVVVLAPTPEAGFGAALAKPFGRNRVRLCVRVIGHTASIALYVRGSKWRFKVLEAIEGFVLRRADLVLPSARFPHDLALRLGASPEKVIRLPVPVRWAERAEIADLPPVPTVLFVGRLAKEKGVHILLQAMALVKQAMPEAGLVVVGDGVERRPLEGLAESLGLHHNVSFLGWLNADQVRDAYRSSSVVVLPSICEEAMGLVLVEAGLMGRPLVGSDIGGIPDAVRHGENGLLFTPGDARALADAIVTVLKDPSLAQRMGREGIPIAREYLAGRDEAVERVRLAIYGLAAEGKQ